MTPLRLCSLSPRLVSDYCVLAFIEIQFGSLLGKRPVFVNQYSPNTYSKLILPVLNWYVITQISLRNLMGIVVRAFFDEKNENLKKIQDTLKLMSDVQNQVDLHLGVRK